MSNPRLVSARPYLERWLFDPQVAEGVAQAHQQANIAQLVYDLRTERNLTQSELAKLVGTTQPVIARLEDADYRGHSLKMLQRIAYALDCELVIAIRPRKKPSKRAAKPTSTVSPNKQRRRAA